MKAKLLLLLKQLAVKALEDLITKWSAEVAKKAAEQAASPTPK